MLNVWKRCESPGGRAEDARLEAYSCPDRKCSGLCFPPQKGGSSSNTSSGTQERDGSLHPPITNSSFANSREEEEDEEGRSLSLSSLHPRLSEVLVGEAYDEGAARCLMCRTCGLTSRRVEGARQESKGIQELLQRGRTFEERGEALASRQCLEQAVGRAEAWLHRGNWVLSELYSNLASVCVRLQVRSTTIAPEIRWQKAAWSAGSVCCLFLRR